MKAQDSLSFNWTRMGKNSQRDSLSKLLKSPLAKKMSIKAIKQSFNWDKGFASEENLPFKFCNYIVIPTIKMDSLGLKFDSLYTPFYSMTYFSRVHLGYYYNASKHDKFNWEGIATPYASSFEGNSKFNPGRNKRVGKKVKSLNADFIFMIENINLHYFYYKGNQLYVLKLTTLDTYTIKDFYTTYVNHPDYTRFPLFKMR